jgi:hypothetical protein
MPAPRYQHGAVFVGARLHVSGGALGGGRVVEADTGVAVLDTAAGAWCAPPPLEGADAEVPGGGAGEAGGAPPAAGGDEPGAPQPADVDAAATPPLVLLSRRCRHAVASVGPFVFMYGGLRGSTLLGDMLLADDSGTGAELMACDPRAPAWCVSFLFDKGGRGGEVNGVGRGLGLVLVPLREGTCDSEGAAARLCRAHQSRAMHLLRRCWGSGSGKRGRPPDRAASLPCL